MPNWWLEKVRKRYLLMRVNWQMFLTRAPYTLNTNNLPILTTLKGWKYGFDSPFKAEVYFVNTRLFTDGKMGHKKTR